VQQAILEAVPEADLYPAMVWIGMLPDDTEEAARAMTASMPSHPRVQHFYDPDRRAGQAIARQLGGPGAVAWDIYLFYGKGREWTVEPPLPSRWMHQLADSTWADAAHYHKGDDLIGKLREAVLELL
jgi:hypothetical protein